VNNDTAKIINSFGSSRVYDYQEQSVAPQLHSARRAKIRDSGQNNKMRLLEPQKSKMFTSKFDGLVKSQNSMAK
jgi:hypothetical protein